MTTKSVSGQPFRMNDGDWLCDDINCQNINFARRMSCNLCGKDRPNETLKHSSNKDMSSESKRKLGHEIGKQAAEKSKGLFSADDWQCGRCGNVNWARRSTCNMCSAPKFGDNEERTGLGGGYNERERVEYIQREDSDDEYDDFGRKKKKLKKSNNEDNDSSNDSKHNKNIGSKHNEQKQSFKYNKHKVIDSKKTESSDEQDNGRHRPQDEEDNGRHRPHDEDQDEEEEDGGDVSKYKLDSDEDEDDDDEDDEDLSKYDLSDWGTDKK